MNFQKIIAETAQLVAKYVKLYFPKLFSATYLVWWGTKRILLAWCNSFRTLLQEALSPIRLFNV